MKLKNTLLSLSLLAGIGYLMQASAEATTQSQIIAAEAIENLVLVPGGSFQLSYTPRGSLTTLDSFYMSKFKVTAGDVFYYADLQGVELFSEKDLYLYEPLYDEVRKVPHVPGRANWEQANNYCSWLGQLTGLKFALPTDAQWEYAARSAGQDTVMATDNGYFDGFNAPVSIDWGLFSYWYDVDYLHSWTVRGHFMPSDYYPPNPLGIYGMVNNGLEWVLDWHAPAAVAASYAVGHNPTGPEQPYYTDKNESRYHSRTSRSGRDSRPTNLYSRGGIHHNDGIWSTFRCVVNQAELQPQAQVPAGLNQ